jgi:hypothetical protein
MPFDDTDPNLASTVPDADYEDAAERMLEAAGCELIRSFTEDGKRRFIVLRDGDWDEIVGVGPFYWFAMGAKFATRNLIHPTC